MKETHIKEKEKLKVGEIPMGPWKYNPNNPTHVSSKWKIGTGQRGEIKTLSNRIESPGPPHYALKS